MSKRSKWKTRDWSTWSLGQDNPTVAVIALIVVYFLLDMIMMDVKEELQSSLTILFTILAPLTLYSHYVVDYQRDRYPLDGTDIPKFIKSKKNYAVIGWLVLTVYGVAFLIAEPLIVPEFFPMLDAKYYRSQLTLMLYVAPIIEEIIFRYLLYDRWLRRKWGWFWGFLVSSLIFVCCHPITNLHALVIYWVPTLMFFLVYHEFGLYGSIVVHMLYNMMAI